MDEKLEAERLTAQQKPPFGLARAGVSVVPVLAEISEKPKTRSKMWDGEYATSSHYAGITASSETAPKWFFVIRITYALKFISYKSYKFKAAQFACIDDNTKPFVRMGRKAYRVSPRQPGRRNIMIDIQRPGFFCAVTLTLHGAGRRRRLKKEYT